MEWILHLGVILLAAKFGAELFQRFGMSAVIGEIAIGVVLGHSVLNVIPESHFIEQMAELGVIFMIFALGLETKVTHLMEVGITATIVALGGLIVPLVCGYGLGVYLDMSWQQALFLGALLMATSVAISTRVFLDGGMGRSRVTRTIVAAAVIDDIVGLIILTIILAVSGRSETSIGLMMAEQGVLLFVVFPLAIYFVPKLVGWLRRMEGEGALFAVIIGATLLFSYGVVPIGMEPIIGAFLIGVVFGSSQESITIERQTVPIVHFLAPIFFVHVGLMVDVNALGQGLALAFWLTVIAAFSKVVGCGGAALLRGLNRHESLLVGVGMIPRGEVGLIIAGIGARIGMFDDKTFSAAALMCVLTILIVPPILTPLAKRSRKPPDEDRNTDATPSEEH